MGLIQSLAIESWTLYSLGVIIVLLRILSRRIKLGKWKALAVDDYLMLFATVNFTGVVVSINEVAANGSNYMPPEDAAALTPEGVQEAVYGSIMTFVLEIFTLTATWTVKACLLILYARLTRNALAKQYVMVKIAALYCLVTYLLVMFLFLFYWCSPTREYWAVPVRISEPPPPLFPRTGIIQRLMIVVQCATYYHHMIFATACNISSDILLLLIPIPIIIRTRLPTKRKIILCSILGLGVFNILAAILNRWYNFSLPNSYIFLYWYVAEVGIAMVVGNMPLCWPILRLLLGPRHRTETPSFHGETISGGRQKRRPRHPMSTIGTAVMGTTWDKLDDREDGDKASGPPDAQRAGSDRDSHIELVLQGATQNLHHHASIHANDEADTAPIHPSVEAEAIEESSRNGQKVRAGDKIVVVTTVDVSTEHS